MRAHQRVAARHDTGDQFVDKRVLGTAQRGEIEPRRREEFARIDPPAVRGIEQDRAAAHGRLVRLERGIELVLDFQHDVRAASKALRFAKLMVTRLGLPRSKARGCDPSNSITNAVESVSAPKAIVQRPRRGRVRRTSAAFTSCLPAIWLMECRGPAQAAAGVRVIMPQILLAEDDIDMRRFLGKALQNAGFDVKSYDNGLSAYQRLREEPFELLLTDIVMPEMDGIELARRAAELDPDIKIMFITGFAAVALNSDSSAPKHAKVLS